MNAYIKCIGQVLNIKLHRINNSFMVWQHSEGGWINVCLWVRSGYSPDLIVFVVCEQPTVFCCFSCSWFTRLIKIIINLIKLRLMKHQTWLKSFTSCVGLCENETHFYHKIYQKTFKISYWNVYLLKIKWKNTIK